MRFVIACPSDSETGGPEALHQLRLALSELGHIAELWDPFLDIPQIVAAKKFSLYEPVWLTREFCDDAVIVVPEVWTFLLPKLTKNHRCVLWWLSVDNRAISSTEDIRNSVSENLIHAAQSQYAIDHVTSLNLGTPLLLTDYIRDEFVDAVWNSSLTKPQPLAVSYYPHKSKLKVDEIKEYASEITFMALENMSPKEIKEALLSSSIYIDMGPHPGRDRIPREAALLGNVIITGKRGAARNTVDIPIAESYKIDEEKRDWIPRTLNLIKNIDSNFSAAIYEQKTYRDWIARNKEIFTNEVLDFVSYLEGLGNPPTAVNVDPSRLNARSNVLANNLSLYKQLFSDTQLQLASMKELVNELGDTKFQLELELQKLEQMNSAIKNSFSWRCTKLLRVISSILSKNIHIMKHDLKREETK